MTEQLPAIGSNWRHLKNRRIVHVLGVEHSGDREQWLTKITFRYKRGAGGTRTGFFRGLAPPQTVPLDEWRRFFKEQG